MDHVRILIADSHPIVRIGLRTLLQTLPNIQVVGDADTGEDTIAKALTLQPDIILTDLQMPDMILINVIRSIVEKNQFTRFLVLIDIEEYHSISEVMQSGAVYGCLLKVAKEEETVRAIQAVCHGGAIFSPAIAQYLINYLSASSSRTPLKLAVFPELTSREREILILVSQGYTNQAIAEQLALSSRTVRNYVSAILSKLQVHSRAEAIARAHQAGLNHNWHKPRYSLLSS